MDVFRVFFVYVRFDRHFDMIKSVDDLNYVLSDTGKVLLKRILETSSSYIFWSMVRLENYVGEEDAYLNCLNLIKKQEFETKVLDQSINLIQNKLYKFT